MQALCFGTPVPSCITLQTCTLCVIFGTLVTRYIALRHASFTPSTPCLATCQSYAFGTPRAQPLYHVTCNFVPSASPSPSAPSCQVLSLPNVLFTRGLGGLWAVLYTVWKMNYGVAQP
ncbi:Hypothetical predicted protein, partial [Prunus dulcis]